MNIQNYTRIRVAAVIVKDKSILLVPHKKNHGEIVWYLPGGKLEFCEKLYDGLIRELKEETGFQGSIKRFFDITESRNSTVFLPGLTPGIKPPFRFISSAI